MEVDGENPEEIVSKLNIRSRSKLSSFKLGRSRSSVLFSESIPFESGRFAAYERLSESMRLSDEPPSTVLDMNKPKKSSAWGFISKVLSFRKSGDGAGAEKKEVKRNRKFGSSWLPDPNRRWPVQGWG